MPNSQEVATIRVDGHLFDEWESVIIVHRWAEAYAEFRFTAAEYHPVPPQWTALQFLPGQKVEIWLGLAPAKLAFVGIIVQRQVAYDGRSHAVQLSGKSLSWIPATSSVETRTGNFDGKDIIQVAREVIGPYPVGLKIIGTIDRRPFERLQNEKGELIWDFLERLARQRGVIMGSDHLGNILMIGLHTHPVVQQLTEGDNILKGQIIFSKEKQFQWYKVHAQAPSDDRLNGVPADFMHGVAFGSPLFNRLRLLVNEQPPRSAAENQIRAQYERLWGEGTAIEAYFTVQGWFRDGSNLWHAGDVVMVRSPMAAISGAMAIQTVTYMQDNKSGTTTLLHCRQPEALLDGNRGIYNVTLPRRTGDPSPVGGNGDGDTPQGEVIIGPIQEDPHVETPESGSPVIPPNDPSRPPSGEFTEDDYPAPSWGGVIEGEQ